MLILIENQRNLIVTSVRAVLRFVHSFYFMDDEDAKGQGIKCQVEQAWGTLLHFCCYIRKQLACPHLTHVCPVQHLIVHSDVILFRSPCAVLDRSTLMPRRKDIVQLLYTKMLQLIRRIDGTRANVSHWQHRNSSANSRTPRFVR